MPLFGGLLTSKADARMRELFTEQAANLVKCAEELRNFFENLHNGEQFMQRIVEHEHKGDDLTYELYEVLDHALITSWLDKYDAINLADHLDSFLDAIRGVARSARLFGIVECRSQAGEFTAIIVEVARLVESLVADLKEKEFSRIVTHHENVSDLERKADDLRDIALRRLWEDTTDNPRLFIAWKEIIEGLEKITDRGNHISQIILSTARKS